MSVTATETPFSELLRSTTGSAHSAAQSSPIVREMFSGTLQKRRFGELAAQYYAIYSALEAGAERLAGDPVAGPFLSPELARVGELEADLQFLWGEGWREEIPLCDATKRYVARLNEVASEWPGGFVAHHYVRYLGDLSGGQHIGKAVARIFGLEFGTDGTRFYNFVDIADPDAFKNAYREKLNAIALSAEEKDRVVAEALRAYELNTALLAEV